MIRRSLIILAAVLCFIASLPSAAFAGEAKSRFDTLRERVEAGDMSVDFKELRLAYTETPKYTPYGGDARDAASSMRKAIMDDKFKKTLTYAGQVLTVNYVDIEAHMASAIAYESTGDQAKADHHKAVAIALAKSIMADGDGKSVKSAYTVISVDEEYVLLDLLGLKSTKQALLNEDGHFYDKLSAVDTETKEPQDMYFQIDLPYNWLDKSLGKSLGEK